MSQQTLGLKKHFDTLIFACNAIPPCPDDTDAFFRRWLQVGFTRQFMDDDPNTDPSLKEKVETQEVAEAVLAWAIKGLQRLLKNSGHFTFTKSMKETRLQYERSTNPTAAFAADNLEANTAEKIEKEYMIRSYLDYCKRTKLPTQGDKVFTEQLRHYPDFIAELQTTWDQEKKVRISYWHNVTWRKDSPYNIAKNPTLNNDKNPCVQNVKSGQPLMAEKVQEENRGKAPMEGIAKNGVVHKQDLTLKKTEQTDFATFSKENENSKGEV
jgi:phage/plasmid-associated DNA primase